MYAVTVWIRIKAERLAEFLPLMMTNAALSLGQEPGCHRFDVCTDSDRSDEIFLYELYTNRAAFEAHLASDHFKAFDEAVSDMIASKHLQTFDQVPT
ncbi:putative quinol monooxygenase [Thalassococcus lentus]|uniref:Quinol monooxygenase n=1 Tax=Thalassococcus lentus TaxID=1210524 RepID=A0ABT4XTZ4_9RHOB|nr:putative quinol monooxygenase [Thalassococcus lentus]MDA7425403.1 putative quinol monooxygenase [Thalassococcus lentus]